MAYGKLVPFLPETIITHGPGPATQLSTTGLLTWYVLSRDEMSLGA